MRAAWTVPLLSVLLASCAAQIGDLDDPEGELDLVSSGLRASRVALEFDVVGYRCPAGGATCGAPPTSASARRSSIT
ncbi:MAG: hypothetical protein M5U28_13260 [Sandaracinaceae bacterium]|nr:hypothetical protein [Sandaracinaceae bacterium]